MSLRGSTYPRAAIAVVILSLTLSGCASAPDALKQSTADQLQTGVQSVTAAASAGDLRGALAALDELQADLLRKVSAGEVTGSRSAEIQSAINLVGADLDAAIEASTPAPPPVPAPEPTMSSKPGKGDDNDDKDDKDNDNDDEDDDKKDRGKGRDD